MGPFGFAFSAAITQVLTNLDNFAVLLGVILTMGARRAVFGYVMAQVIVLGSATGFAHGISVGLAGWSNWLGLVPLTIGARGVWLLIRDGSDAAPDQLRGRQGTYLASLLLFLSLSMDSLAVMAPLLADTSDHFRPYGLTGAIMAVLALGALAFTGVRAAGPWARKLQNLGPYVMVVVGVYVLLDTGTDLM